MRNSSRNSRTRKNTAANRTMPWHYFILMVLCIAVITAGFFFTAVQHFSAIDLSIKNSDLRTKITQLEAEQRRLMLEREIAGSPSEIKKTAVRLGFREFDAAAELALLRPETPAKPEPQAASEKPVVETKQQTTPEQKLEQKLSKPEQKTAETKPETPLKRNRPADTKPVETDKKPTIVRTGRDEIARANVGTRNAEVNKTAVKKEVSAEQRKVRPTAAIVIGGQNKAESVETRPRRVNLK